MKNSSIPTIQKVDADTHMPRSAGHPLKLILVGEGGQGIQTVAKVLSKAVFSYGYHASFIPNFGTEQRGGLSLAFIQISKADIISPKFRTADLFVITSDRDIERVLRYIGLGTNVLYDPDLVNSSAASRFTRLTPQVVPVRAFYEATQKFTERSFNIILLGILTGLIDTRLSDTVLKEMNSKFEKYYLKAPQLKAQNEQAFNLGLSMTHL